MSRRDDMRNELELRSGHPDGVVPETGSERRHVCVSRRARTCASVYTNVTTRRETKKSEDEHEDERARSMTRLTMSVVEGVRSCSCDEDERS